MTERSDDGGGLQLNLSSGQAKPAPAKRPPSPTPETREDSNPKKKVKKNDGESKKPQAPTGDSGPVVSSLFKHNPEIPQLNFDSEVRNPTYSISVPVHKSGCCFKVQMKFFHLLSGSACIGGSVHRPVVLRRRYPPSPGQKHVGHGVEEHDQCAKQSHTSHPGKQGRFSQVTGESVTLSSRFKG